MPASLARILEATAQRETTVAELGRLVAADPSFAVRVLKLVNSSFHARGTQIASVHKAVSRLGLQSLRNLALTTAATGGHDAKALYPFDLDRFWEDSLRRGAAAELLAETGVFGDFDPAAAFTAGLLQDLPVLALVQSCPGKSESWMNLVGEEPFKRRREERKLYGVSHDDLATEMATEWQLPEPISMVMRFHHEPAQAPPEYQERCQLHSLAEELAAVYGADDTAAVWRRARQSGAVHFNHQESVVDELIEKVGRRVIGAARSLGMKVGDQPDLRRLHRQAKRDAEMGDLSRPQLVHRVRQLMARNDALHRELVRLRETVAILSATDEVTGLPDRRALETRLALELRRAARSGEGVALVWLSVVPRDESLDLVEIEQIVGIGIGATMRGTDLVTRAGPGTFGLVLPDTTLEGAVVAARRALAGARDERHDVTDWAICSGLACIEGLPDGSACPEELVERLIERAQKNCLAARTAKRPIVRTGAEAVSWTDESAAA